jgi:hypothetical protein
MLRGHLWSVCPTFVYFSLLLFADAKSPKTPFQGPRTPIRFSGCQRGRSSTAARAGYICEVALRMGLSSRFGHRSDPLYCVDFRFGGLSRIRERPLRVSLFGVCIGAEANAGLASCWQLSGVPTQVPSSNNDLDGRRDLFGPYEIENPEQPQ